MINRTFIIAEAGVNHNGNIDMAFKLIDAAKAAGVDAVKFQTFTADAAITKYAQKADYQKQTTGSEQTQYEMVKKLELSKKNHLDLLNYCKLKEILFLSTPFDLDSIDLLEELQIPIMKVPSGEITNLPYLRKIGKTKKPIIMSTGMATITEIEFALDVLIHSGTRREAITLLHCNTEYPTPFEDVNLNAMQTLKNHFNDIAVGYSDHTLGIIVPVSAVAIGATVIEKHFTLDKTLPGPDHPASLEPHELKEMVEAIRIVEKIMGNGVKTPSESEKKNIFLARKSIVAKTQISKGDIFSEVNLTTKRPGSGISPIYWDEIFGKTANRNYEIDEMIERI